MSDKAGRLALPGTTQGGFGSGRTSAPPRDWRSEYLGPDFGQGRQAMYEAVTTAVYAVMGGPPVLSNPAAPAPSTREAHRELLLTPDRPGRGAPGRGRLGALRGAGHAPPSPARGGRRREQGAGAPGAVREALPYLPADEALLLVGWE